MTVGTSNGDCETVRVRFPPWVLDDVDGSVERGEYATRAEFVGEAIQRLAEE